MRCFSASFKSQSTSQQLVYSLRLSSQNSIFAYLIQLSRRNSINFTFNLLPMKVITRLYSDKTPLNGSSTAFYYENFVLLLTLFNKAQSAPDSNKHNIETAAQRSSGCCMLFLLQSSVIKTLSDFRNSHSQMYPTKAYILYQCAFSTIFDYCLVMLVCEMHTFL